MKSRHPVLLLCSLALFLAGTGCKTYRSQASAMRDAWVQGRYAEAARKFEQKANKKDDGKDGDALKVVIDMLKRLGHLEHNNLSKGRQIFREWKEEWMAKNG